jgi:hypothetical protein
MTTKVPAAMPAMAPDPVPLLGALVVVGGWRVETAVEVVTGGVVVGVVAEDAAKAMT